MKLRVLDLFSGIGGFSLGLERTGGFETVAFCEIEPFPRRVLAKHWPEVPCYHDVRELTAARLAADGITEIDVITGGFPCQDISHAGHQAGITGERSGLWSEILRLICELRPQFAALENVSALLSGERGAWMGRVLGDLAEAGYDAEWRGTQAYELGAWQERDRCLVVAYPNEVGREALPIEACLADQAGKERDWQQVEFRGTRGGFLRPVPTSRTCGMDHGFPEGLDRIGACGNALVPAKAFVLGRAILESRRAA